MARTGTALRKIRVMISSQCNRKFPAAGRTLTEIRRELRDRIEGVTLLGEQIFEVWINEDAPAAGLEQNSWEKCLGQVRQADVLIVLDAGHAGWALRDGEVGICHAELMTGFNSAPGKVRIVPLQGTEPLGDENAARNRRFTEYVGRLSAFSPPVKSEEELYDAVERALLDAVTSLVALGVREARKGRYHSGDPLEWGKLGFADRRDRMIQTLSNALQENGGVDLGAGIVSVPLAGRQVAFHLHASPAALSLAPSRELVGRPFLGDYQVVGDYPQGVVGPVHLIACHSGATETQGRNMLGFPDAVIVPAPFGLFVADEAQQIQFALLNGCRDETTTRHAVARFFDWLRQTDQEQDVAAAAASRAKISRAVAAEVRRLGAR